MNEPIPMATAQAAVGGFDITLDAGKGNAKTYRIAAMCPALRASWEAFVLQVASEELRASCREMPGAAEVFSRIYLDNRVSKKYAWGGEISESLRNLSEIGARQWLWLRLKLADDKTPGSAVDEITSRFTGLQLDEFYRLADGGAQGPNS